MRHRGIAFLLLGVLAPALAFAQSPEDALLNDCYALRRAGRHAASLPRCEEAASSFPSGRSLTQLALTEMALERWAAAATHLTAALADHAHPWVQSNRPAVEEALRTVRAHVGALEVATNVPGATVLLRGRAPLPASTTIFASPGRLAVTLRAGDGRVVTRDVSLTAGQTTREQMDFAVAPSAVATHTTAAPVGRSQPHTASPRPSPAAETSTRRVLAWTSAGVSLASFGLALVSWRMREGVVSDYEGECRTARDLDQETRCVQERGAAEGRVSDWEDVTTVGLVAGGVFAVTSAILFATEPSRRGSATTWACAPAIGFAGGHCMLRF